jgi:hypothetical protein
LLFRYEYSDKRFVSRRRTAPAVGISCHIVGNQRRRSKYCWQDEKLSPDRPVRYVEQLVRDHATKTKRNQASINIVNNWSVRGLGKAELQEGMGASRDVV